MSKRYRPAPDHDCCKPYPYAVFRDEALVSVHLVHVGSRCIGHRENVTEQWR